jgi:hypothetical protein
MSKTNYPSTQKRLWRTSAELKTERKLLENERKDYSKLLQQRASDKPMMGRNE